MAAHQRCVVGATSTLKTRTWSFWKISWWCASLVISTSVGVWAESETAASRSASAWNLLHRLKF